VPSSSPVAGLGFVTTGTLCLAVCTADREVRAWEVASKRLLCEASLEAAGGVAAAAFFVRDASTVHVVTTGQDSALRVWDLGTRRFAKLLWASRGFYQSLDARGMDVGACRGLRPHQQELLEFSGCVMSGRDFKAQLVKGSALHASPTTVMNPVVSAEHGWLVFFLLLPPPLLPPSLPPFPTHTHPAPAPSSVWTFLGLGVVNSRSWHNRDSLKSCCCGFCGCCWSCVAVVWHELAGNSS
jgi:hypothetical protein